MKPLITSQLQKYVNKKIKFVILHKNGRYTPTILQYFL
jgi:hypothetical protein